MTLSRASMALARVPEPVVAGVVVALGSLAIYLRTLLPDVGFWDTAEFQAIGPVLGIAHPTGFPTYTLLAWLASVVLQPFGNEALRANMLSALLVSGGVGIVAATTAVLTRRVVLGIAAGAALAVAPEVWTVALHADPHALHLLFSALLLLTLVGWMQRTRDGRNADGWLLGAAIVFGLSLGNHALTFLLAPGITAFLLLVDRRLVFRWRLVVACAAALALTTLAVYLYLPLRSSMNPPLDYANPETWDGFRYLVFAEQFRGTFRALPDAAVAVRQVAEATFTQLGPLAVLALVGVALAPARRRAALAVLLVAWFAVSWIFALGYINADIGRYYIVPLLAVVVLGALGADAIWDALRSSMNRPLDHRRRAVSAAATLLAAVVLIGPTLAVVPARLGELDESRDVAARRWLTATMNSLPEDALVVSWWSYSTTLWYAQHVEGLRPDVTIIDDSTIVQQRLGDVAAVIDTYLGHRPVFLIRLPRDVPQFEARYEMSPLPAIPGGTIYEVHARRAAGGHGHL